MGVAVEVGVALSEGLKEGGLGLVGDADAHVFDGDAQHLGRGGWGVVEGVREKWGLVGDRGR